MPQINASQLAHTLDRDVSAWTPARLSCTFQRYGCAVVRNAIPKPLLAQTEAAVLRAHSMTTEYHVYDPQIEDASNRKLSGYELVDSALLRDFLTLVFSHQKYVRHSAQSRRIAEAASQGWQPPLLLHMDSQYHQFQFTVNFWIPFQDCGVDAPGLQLLPLNYQLTRKFSGYTGALLNEGRQAHFGFFPDDAFQTDRIKNAFGSECLFHPVMNAGDLIVSSNWIIHGSYHRPEMTKTRTSIEIRFMGENLDIGLNFMTRSLMKFRGVAKRVARLRVGAH